MLEIAREQTAKDFVELISLKGSLDTYTARDFDRFFQEFVQAGFHFFILDASMLQTVSSGGLASIARLTKNIAALGGAFVFLDLPAEIKMLFSFLTLTKRIPIFTNMEEAMNFFSNEAQGNRAASFRQGLGEREGLAPQQKSIPEVEAESAYTLQASPKAPAAKAEPKRTTGERSAMAACTHCGLQLSVKKTGPYMCPGCGQQFQVNL